MGPGATGCVIYRAGSYETDDRFVIAEYRSFEDFRTGTVFKTISGKALRLTPGNRPIIIPYPRAGMSDRDRSAIRSRIAAAKDRFRHLGMDLSKIEKAWDSPAESGVSASATKETAPTAGSRPPLVLSNGQRYEAWSISRIDEDEVRILHSGGIAAVALADLPEFVVNSEPQLLAALRDRSREGGRPSLPSAKFANGIVSPTEVPNSHGGPASSRGLVSDTSTTQPEAGSSDKSPSQELDRDSPMYQQVFGYIDPRFKHLDLVPKEVITGARGGGALPADVSTEWVSSALVWLRMKCMGEARIFGKSGDDKPYLIPLDFICPPDSAHGMKRLWGADGGPPDGTKVATISAVVWRGTMATFRRSMNQQTDPMATLCLSATGDVFEQSVNALMFSPDEMEANLAVFLAYENKQRYAPMIENALRAPMEVYREYYRQNLHRSGRDALAVFAPVAAAIAKGISDGTNDSIEISDVDCEEAIKKLEAVKQQDLRT